MFALMVTRGDEACSMWFDRVELSIGRAAGNHLVLAAPEVSKRHARLVLKDGKYIIVDLKSTNGTFINGRRVSSPLVVKPDHDQIRICEFVLQISETTSPGVSPQALPGQYQVGAQSPDDTDQPTELYEWRTPMTGPEVSGAERELLHAIYLAPDDDGPRLVYADWLMERGDARGELIALQCRGAVDVPRVRALLDANGSAWLLPFGEGASYGFELTGRGATATLPHLSDMAAGLRPVLARGFLEHPLCLSRGKFEAADGKLFRLSPTVYVPVRVRCQVGEELFVDGVGFGAGDRDDATADGHGRRVVLRASRSGIEPGELRIPRPMLTEQLWYQQNRTLQLFEEATLGVRLDHPNVVRYHGLAYWGVWGEAAVVTEDLGGAPLGELVSEASRSASPLSPGVVCGVVAQLCAGVQAICEAAEILEVEMNTGGAAATREAAVRKAAHAILAKRAIHDPGYDAAAFIRSYIDARKARWDTPMLSTVHPGMVEVTPAGEVLLVSMDRAQSNGSPRRLRDPSGYLRQLPDALSAFMAREVLVSLWGDREYGEANPCKQSAVFSCALILRELATGADFTTLARRRSPLALDAAPEWRADGRAALLAPPLRPIVETGLDPLPARRFASAGELRRALEHTAEEQGWDMSPAAIASELRPLFRALASP